MLIIAALGELFTLIVSLAIIFIKWHRMEQRYENKEKEDEEFLGNKDIEIFVIKKKEEK